MGLHPGRDPLSIEVLKRSPFLAQWLLRLALGLGLTSAATLAAAPAQLPAAPSALAYKVLLTASAKAGQRVVAVGAYGNIVYSDDGNTWRQADNVPVQALLTSVFFVNESEGWAAGHDSLILHTADGGRNWETLYENLFPDNDVPKPILGLYFSDPLHGIAVGAFSLIMVTEDGGKHWDSIDTTPLRELLQDAGQETEPNFNAIIPHGDGYLIAGELGTLISFRPADAGGTSEPRWHVLKSPYAGSFFGARELAAQALLVYGLRGHCFLSRDQGETWTAIDTGTTANLYDALALDNGDLIVVGAGGTILRIPRDGTSAARLPYNGFNGFVSAQRVGDRELLLFGDMGAHRFELP